MEHGGDGRRGSRPLRQQNSVIVNALVEERLDGSVCFFSVRRNSREAPRKEAHIVDIVNLSILSGFPRSFYERGNQHVDEQAETFEKPDAGRSGRIAQGDGFPDLAELGSTGGEFFQIGDSGGAGVVKIGCIVGDLVCEIDQLGLDRRAQTWQVCIEQRVLAGLEITRMLNDSFPNFECEIESGKPRIALLESLNNSQRVKIVIEAVVKAAHLSIEFAFTSVAKRRMPDIMAKRQGFGQVFLEMQGGSGSASDLRYLDGMGETSPEMIREFRGENLGLVFEAAKRSCMNDAIAIALEIVTVAVRRFRITPSPAEMNRKPQMGERLRPHSLSRRLLIQHFAEDADGGACDCWPVKGLEGLKKHARFLRLGLLNGSCENELGLLLGNNRSWVIHQFAQQCFRFTGSVLSDIKRSQGQLSQRSDVGVAAFGHFQEGSFALFYLGHVAKQVAGIEARQQAFPGTGVFRRNLGKRFKRRGIFIRLGFEDWSTGGVLLTHNPVQNDGRLPDRILAGSPLVAGVGVNAHGDDDDAKRQGAIFLDGVAMFGKVRNGMPDFFDKPIAFDLMA